MIEGKPHLISSCQVLTDTKMTLSPCEVNVISRQRMSNWLKKTIQKVQNFCHTISRYCLLFAIILNESPQNHIHVIWIHQESHYYVALPMWSYYSKMRNVLSRRKLYMPSFPLFKRISGFMIRSIWENSNNGQIVNVLQICNLFLEIKNRVCFIDFSFANNIIFSRRISKSLVYSVGLKSTPRVTS